MEVTNCNIGDRVICVDNAMVEDQLTIGEIIIVKDIEDYKLLNGVGDSYGDTYINGYFSWRFEDIRKYRRKKLKRINSL